MSGVGMRYAGVAVGALVVAGAVGWAIGSSAGASEPQPGKLHTPLTTRVFASGGSLSSPDDITQLDGHVFVAWQNGVGPQGEASPQGGTKSTVVEYNRAGHRLDSWDVTGKVDGMAAGDGRVAATVNEDDNSSIYTIAPAAKSGAVQHYSYSPNPLPHGGGTDSVAFSHGAMYVTASSPSADQGGKTYSQPALYRVTLQGSVAKATSVLADNAPAKSALTGSQVKLNLSDPDSSASLPSASPRFAGDVLLDSQGDSQQVFVHEPGTQQASASVLDLSTQVDDTAVTTSPRGTLFVADEGSNKVMELKGQFGRGRVFTSVADDAPTMPGTLGLLDLQTGAISPVAKLKSPAGLLFMR